MLLSAEAELVALPQAVEELMFVIQLLGSMKISVKLPVIVRVYNIGATFLTSKNITTSHMKHVSISYKYFIEYMEDRVVKAIFGASAKNDSNILK